MRLGAGQFKATPIKGGNGQDSYKPKSDPFINLAQISSPSLLM